MQLSEQWLRTWVDPCLDSKELAHLLTMSGLEVEEEKAIASFFNQVVIAEVIAVHRHKNADRLHVCTVDIGHEEPLQIVCGAPNVAVGIKVPCAQVGAVLPGNIEIKQVSIRGIDSFGMLCSAKELGFSETSSTGLMILPTSAPVGECIRRYLQLDDHILTIKLTPNRADCLSVYGIAREVAALTQTTCNEVHIEPISPTISDTREVTLSASCACPLYLGRIIKGIDPSAPIPLWMKQRLERSGIRPISSLVDITNYVMLELGQPLHAFDLDKLNGSIAVRFAKSGETMTLLNGKILTMDTNMLVIADEIKPIALAGVMGSSETAIGSDCHDIFLESAFFLPHAVAGLARRIGLNSESVYRFERGVDFKNTGVALDRATTLIIDICGGSPGPVVEEKMASFLPTRHPITLRMSRIEKILGTFFSADQVIALLNRLQCSCTKSDEHILTVVPPSFRFDMSIEEDLVEEIARLSGYDHLPIRPARTALSILPRHANDRGRTVLKHILASREYQEVVNYAFIDEQVERDWSGNEMPIHLVNPISNYMNVMRSSIWGGLVSNLRYNLNRQQERVRLFELGRVFFGVNPENQPEKIAGLVWGTRFAEQWGAPKEQIDFFDVKADVEALLSPHSAQYRQGANHPALHPGRSAEIWLDGKIIGLIGEVHPRHVQAYDFGTAPILFELDVATLRKVTKVQIHPVSKFQSVRRDLALVVEESFPVSELLDALSTVGKPIVAELSIFDLYRGKGIPPAKKSLALKVVMQDMQKTLMEKEIEAVIAELIATAQRHGAVLRATAESDI